MPTKKTTILKPVSVSEQLFSIREEVKSVDSLIHSAINQIDNQMGDIRREHWKLADVLEDERRKKKARSDMYWIYAVVIIYIIFLGIYATQVLKRR